MGMKVGVYICECGPNIADKIDIDSIIRAIPSMEEFEGVECVVKRYKLLCSKEGQAFLADEIKSQELTHLVVAACSPRDHEATFMNVCKDASLNPYLFKMVNIREHCAWIISDKEEATQKAVRYIRAGIRRVMSQSELMEKELESRPDVLIIGGGVAGLEAALILASPERKVYLVEKSGQLGGKSIHSSSLLPRHDGSTDVLKTRISEIEKNEQIRVFLNTEMEKAVGFFGNFEITLKSRRESEAPNEIQVGAVVIATGFQLMNPKIIPSFQYAEEDDVYDLLNVEQFLGDSEKMMLRTGKPLRSVALVHCVGREEKGYCSGFCCTTLLSLARRLKEKLPGVSVTAYHRDLCLAHKTDQAFYEEVKGLGVQFVRVKGVQVQGKRLSFFDMEDKKKEETPDMIILAPAMEPDASSEKLDRMLRIHRDDLGFFRETHHHLNPVATSTDGIYIVGACRGPMGISDSILQAQAAGGKILTRLIPGKKFVPEVKVSEIMEAFCTGCKACLDVCCYGAIFFNEEKNISVVNEAVCRGCGNCAAACPSGAIRAKHFTGSQLYQEIIEAIR